jgi:hypothetical protein
MSVLQKMRLKFARTISLSFGISPRRFAIGMNLKIETVKATGQTAPAGCQYRSLL